MRLATLSTESNSKGYIPNFDEYVHFSTISASFPTPGIDFSLLGDTLFTHIFQAPTGMRFHASFAQGGRLTFGAEAGSRTSTAGQYSSNDSILTFNGFGGTPLSPLESSVFITGPNTGFNPDSSYAGANVGVSAGADFWFESFSIQSLVPAAFITNLPSRQLSADIRGTIRTADDADFGQFVWLEAIPSSTSVPEPSSWLLIIFGGLMLRLTRRQ